MIPTPSGDARRHTALGPDAQAAARALLAVLSHPDVATSVDERLFEALLVYGLQAIPGLGAALFGCDPDVAFTLGRRGSQADIVGLRNGTVTIECEIKLHSNVHWPRGVCQLDNYADREPAEAALFIVTDQDRLPHLQTELADEEYPVHSKDRWKILHHHTVRDAVERTVGRPLAGGDGSAERLARALARLVEAEAPPPSDDQSEAAGGDG